MPDLLISIASRIGEQSVQPVVRQVRYLFRFKRIVDDLMKANEKLRLMQDRVQHDVSQAVQNAEEIEEDVRMWQMDVDNVMADVQRLSEEMQSSEKCFCGWLPNWIWKYNLAKEATKRAITVVKLLEDGKFNRVSYRPTPSGMGFLSTGKYMAFESTKSSYNQIIEALKDHRSNMIGLHGMGGVGKTTMAKEVGKNVKDLKLFDWVVMAVVSQTLDIIKLQDQIADALGLKFEERSQSGRANQLCSRLKNEKKVLIILDDVWKELDLEAIGIPPGGDCEGCKILVTTRRRSACTSMGIQRTIFLDTLTEAEAWVLFKENAGLVDCSPTLNDVAKDVARECKGLPIAIVTLGRALRHKTLNDWKVASLHLKRSRLLDIEDINEDKNAYASLKLSYDYLKRKETKLCFLLCSLFPEDHEIEVEDLTRIGMGLCMYQVSSSIDEARSQICAVIDHLKASCLLLDIGNMYSAKMHDTVRDFALWKASGGEYVFMVKSGLDEWPRNERFENCTAISFINLLSLPDKVVCPSLEILVLGCRDWVEIAHTFFEGMQQLKVLYLRATTLPLNSLKDLTNLRTLRLENCNLSDLSSLEKMRSLEILSFRGSYIEELPNEIGDLKNLKLLDLTKCVRLRVIAPNVLQRLSLLEELYIGPNSFKSWEVDETSTRSNACLSELSSLTHLSIVSLSLYAKCLPVNFIFPSLQRYEIEISSTDLESGEWSVLFPNPFLHEKYPTSTSLRIKNMEATSLSAFRVLFQNVRQLKLKNARNFLNVFPNLDDWLPQGFLPKLEEVEIIDCKSMHCIFPSKYMETLWRLQKLEVSKCDALQEIFQFDGILNAQEESNGSPEQRQIWKEQVTNVSLQSLTIVKIFGCKRLTSIFSSSVAHSLKQLETITIELCDELEKIIIIDDVKSLRSLSFPKLSTIEVRECNKLEYVFPYSAARGVPQLKRVIIDNASELKHVFGRDGKEEDATEDCGKHIVLLDLTELTLDPLPKLCGFYECNFVPKWPCLQKLSILKCPNLPVNFILDLQASIRVLQKKLRIFRLEIYSQLWDTVVSLMREGLLNLEVLRLEHCEVQQVLFQLEGMVRDERQTELLFSNLKQFQLSNLNELEVIWKGPTQILSLENLTELEIQYCKRLRYILSCTLALNLPRLKVLNINGCEELEKIIGDENNDEKNQNLHICFPNLWKIRIERCNKLKTLFPVTIAQGFPALEWLEVMRSDQLEGIFETANEVDFKDERVIQLPKLSELTLEELPSLISFCPRDYHFVFPYLRRLTVQECFKQTTSFTCTSDGSVHAKAEAPQINNESITPVSETIEATSAAVESTNTNNINWYDPRKPLASYF